MSGDDVHGIDDQVAMVSQRIDECWIELESAETWEQVKEIGVRLGEAYELRKALRRNLTE